MNRENIQAALAIWSIFMTVFVGLNGFIILISLTNSRWFLLSYLVLIPAQLGIILCFVGDNNDALVSGDEQ